MKKCCVMLCACLFAAAAPAAAQNRPATLSTLFEDIFGPNGLVVSSDDVQLDGTNHAAHFNSSFQSDFRLINIALTSQLTAVPLPSPASGFTYRFDESTGTFVRSTKSFGPILSDRGDTIGKGQIAFGANAQFFSFDHLDGTSLSQVPAVFRHDNYQSTPGRSDVIFTENTIQADLTQMTWALTYGLTDRLEVSAAVPLVRTHVSLLSNATIERVGTGTNLGVHYFYDPTAPDNHGTARQYFAEGSASGVGDVLLRAKGTVIRKSSLAVAAGVDLHLPSGDEQNLLGSGAFGARPFAALSGTVGALSPHLNVGYQWNGSSVLAGDVRQNISADLPDQFQFAAGTEVTVNPKLTVIFDVLGQEFLNSPRLTTFQFVAQGPFGSVPLQDLGFTTDSFWATSGSIGLKANLARRLLLNFNLRFATNHAGLTDRLTPLVGMEYAF
ncbi:MAG TPA: hypothetical protein VGI12_16455 [Vicinamibacterales bacterium]